LHSFLLVFYIICAEGGGLRQASTALEGFDAYHYLFQISSERLIPMDVMIYGMTSEPATFSIKISEPWKDRFWVYLSGLRRNGIS
jgi:hypothetical protein